MSILCAHMMSAQLLLHLKPLWLAPVNAATLGQMHCRVKIEQSCAQYSNEHWDEGWLVGLVVYLV